MSSSKLRTFVAAIALRLLCDLATVSAVRNLDDWAVNAGPVPRSSNLHYWDPDFLKNLILNPTDLDPGNPAANNLELLPPDNLGQWQTHPNYRYPGFSPPSDNWDPGHNPSNYLNSWNPLSSIYLESWDPPGSNYMDSWGPWRSRPSNSDSWDPPGSIQGRSRSNYLDSLGSDNRVMKTRSIFTYPRPKYWVPESNSEMKKHRYQHHHLGPMVDILELRPLSERVESDCSEYPVKCWYKYGHSHKYCSE